MDQSGKMERKALARAMVSLIGERSEEAVLPVRGWSMGHTLGPSGEVVVRPLSSPAKFGDIVVAEGESGVIVHRVIGVVRGDNLVLITKGDNCYEADPPLSPAKLIGRASGIRKNGRTRMPWHWKPPLSFLVGFLSRVEAGGYPLVSYTIRRINHRIWRYRMKMRGIGSNEGNRNFKGEKHE